MRDNFPVMMGISKNLRANLKNHRFARNPRQPFKLITTIPQILIRKRKNRTFGAFKLPQKFCVFA